MKTVRGAFAPVHLKLSSMKNNIDIQKVEVNPDTIEYIYLIDGVYYQQKGCKTEVEANEAANTKIKEILSYKRKRK